MNKLDIKKQVLIISALVEGNSIRAACRMTGAAKGTVLKLLADVGKACAEYQHKTLRVTPAMEAGVTDHVWEIEDILLLINWA